jgi:hypothetical protein
MMVHVIWIFDFELAMTQTFALRATDLKPINSYHLNKSTVAP